MPEQPTNISSAIQSLPEHVWDWLTSDAVTLSITEINNRLGFKSERRQIIPSLILKLVTQNLDPMDFINELSHELNIGFQAAKAIAEEIESRVLKPIESELRRDVGVDVKLIYFGKPSAQRAEPPIRGALNAPIPLEAGRPEATVAAPLARRPLTGPTEWEKWHTKSAPPPAAPEMRMRPYEQPAEITSPFILHQETPVAPLTPKTKAEPSLNIKVKDYYQTSEEKKLSVPVPVQVEYAQNDKRPTTNDQQQNLTTLNEMEAGVQNLAANINEQKARIVHYNEMRTPLTNIGTPKATLPENRVDLRKFAKPDINTIDLRRTTND